MYKLVLVFITIIFTHRLSFAQEENFPKDWLGQWKGTMVLDYNSGKHQEIACELHVLEVDTIGVWVWTIVYGEGEKKQERHYKLLLKDKEKGLYAIDESNSIVLEAFYANSTLTSQFEVQNNLITTSYQKVGDVIYFQNIASKADKTSRTGGENEIPEVLIYPVSNLQRAKLERVK